MIPQSGTQFLQNMRDFTVQIRDPATQAIIGTGVALDMEGQVITCAHVLQNALGIDPRLDRTSPIAVYFPRADEADGREWIAQVKAYFPQHDDDIVLLQIEGGKSPLKPEQIPVLGSAEASEGNAFRSYGYRRLSDYQAGRADGKIMGDVDPPSGKTLLTDPIQLDSKHINHGMSGAAVLDEARNLVIGIISETYFPSGDGKDRDTGWAVNTRVLSLDPLNLTLAETGPPKRSAPAIQTDMNAARQVRDLTGLRLGLGGDPLPVSLGDEWVGREALLTDISRAYQGGKRVVGLIGFGGEGKSSLARRWLEPFLPALNGEIAPNDDTPLGLFWWSFYESADTDAFFESLLKYITGDAIQPAHLPSASAKANFIMGRLSLGGRYILVLDGFEVMQQQGGSDYGALQSAALRDFLRAVAGGGHEAFVLVTSRAPLLDLLDAEASSHFEVERLSDPEGLSLLRGLGVIGTDEALTEISQTWDGHALTLSLIATYLRDNYGGEAAKIEQIPPPTSGEDRYKRVGRVLRRYDENLSEAERAFLTIFSAFRTPLPEDALQKVFRTPTSQTELNRALTALDEATFAALMQRLEAARLLRHDPAKAQYTTHPLIRGHYYQRLTGGAEAQAVHANVQGYYQDVSPRNLPRFPSLDDLAPLIELVHHACQAGAYDEAHQIRRERIQQRNRNLTVHILGAYETELAIMRGFFPHDDTSQEPAVTDPGAKSFILNAVGFCLMSLGRLTEAAVILERKVKTNLEMNAYESASRGYQNLTGLYTYLGRLEAAEASAGRSLELARQAANKGDEMMALAYQGWVVHLRGKSAEAGAGFAAAEALEREIDSSKEYLYSLRGIQHATQLRRAGQADYARRVTEANLTICERNGWGDDLSMSHRVLGELAADGGEVEAAREHFDQALRLARSIQKRNVLIEALWGRGLFYAKTLHDYDGASDLDEALSLAVAGGYRRYEADIRIALAWRYLAADDLKSARREAESALGMSVSMGYHWGQIDAKEVLAVLEAL